MAKILMEFFRISGDGDGAASPSAETTRPQEAKLLATELLAALRNMKAELAQWK